jgi:hypothetical protein
LQSALVLVNTRLVDRVLTAPAWAERLTAPDRRGLTPLFWSKVALHGTFKLDLEMRLDYDLGVLAAGQDTDPSGPFGRGDPVDRVKRCGAGRGCGL